MEVGAHSAEGSFAAHCMLDMGSTFASTGLGDSAASDHCSFVKVS